MTDRKALKVVAGNIRRARESRGMSLNELAKLADTYPSNIKRIEDQESMPGAGMLTRIAEALEISIAQLFAEKMEISSQVA